MHTHSVLISDTSKYFSIKSDNCFFKYLIFPKSKFKHFKDLLWTLCRLCEAISQQLPRISQDKKKKKHSLNVVIITSGHICDWSLIKGPVKLWSISNVLLTSWMLDKWLWKLHWIHCVFNDLGFGFILDCQVWTIWNSKVILENSRASASVKNNW